MKIEIFDEAKEPKEKVLRLRLVRGLHPIESVQVAVVDDKGGRIPQGMLLSIRADGTLNLHREVNTTLGLDLDRYGRLKVHG